MSDLIETLLERLSLRTRVFHRGNHCGNWTLNLENLDKVLFHFVREGNCVFELPEEQREIELEKGDLLLLPRGGNHVLRHSKQVIRDTGPGPTDQQQSVDNDTARLICAFVEIDPKLHNPLFDALPPYVLASADSHPDSDWLKHLLDLLFAEAKSESVGSSTVIERLTDILFIHIIRCYLANCPVQSGILAAYNDSALRPVVELMHYQPQKPWSIADFSATAKLSRTAFIERFTRTLEIPPMTYLTQQRLEFAYRQLREGKRRILDVALDCGYESESSFSKAFKRMYGIAPSALN